MVCAALGAVSALIAPLSYAFDAILERLIPLLLARWNESREVTRAAARQLDIRGRAAGVAAALRRRGEAGEAGDDPVGRPVGASAGASVGVSVGVSDLRVGASAVAPSRRARNVT